MGVDSAHCVGSIYRGVGPLPRFSPEPLDRSLGLNSSISSRAAVDVRTKRRLRGVGSVLDVRRARQGHGEDTTFPGTVAASTQRALVTLDEMRGDREPEP